MSYYKIPIYGASWGTSELLRILQAMMGKPRDETHALEELVSNTVGGQAVLLNSGRSAIELALGAIRERQHDQSRIDILVPSLICKAVPEKIVCAGFKPKFFEVLPEVSPDPADLMEKLGPSVAAVIFPYLYGRVVDVKEVVRTCRSYNIPVIEDCAASFLLSNENGEMAGTQGDYVVFSFSIGKTLVAGAGGAFIDRTRNSESNRMIHCWTNTEERRLARGKLSWMLHYILKRTGYYLQMITGTLGRDYYLDTIEELHPISQIDSALVMEQFKKFRETKMRKQAVLDRYRTNLDGQQLVDVPQLREIQYVNRLFVAFKDPLILNSDDDSIHHRRREFLSRKGVQTQLPYFPAHRRKEYEEYCVGDLKNTELVYKTLLEIPSQPTMSISDVDFVCESIIKSASLR